MNGIGYTLYFKYYVYSLLIFLTPRKKYEFGTIWSTFPWKLLVLIRIWSFYITLWSTWWSSFTTLGLCQLGNVSLTKWICSSSFFSSFTLPREYDSKIYRSDGNTVGPTTNVHICSIVVKSMSQINYWDLLYLETIQIIGNVNDIPIDFTRKIFNLRGYCTPDLFCDCLGIFLKNYNTLVTSKIYFVKVTS